MSQWFLHWASVFCFFFISLTFPCICEWANDSLTGMLSDRRCLSSGGASALSSQLVCVRVCVEKWGGIVRTWPAHFVCSSGDRCSWASTGAWQLPFIAVFSTLNPWPALPLSLFSSSFLSSLHFFILFFFICAWSLLTALSSPILSDGLGKLVGGSCVWWWGTADSSQA